VRRSDQHGRVRGFTLVESIATMAVLGVVFAASSRLLYAAFDGYSAGAVRAGMAAELSSAIDRVTNELRDIQAGSGEGGADIASVTASSITWETNSSLSLTGTSLVLTEAGGTPRILLGEVSGFVVQTYDAGGSLLGASLSGAACQSIQRVMVTISVARSGVTETMRTMVCLRASATE
jgi:prepilin-type N-terminal cleavage/methylation domain-containing protein